MFSSNVVKHFCVGLDVAFTCNLFLTVYNATVVDGAVAHAGLGIKVSRGCIDRDGQSVVVSNEVMIYVNETIWL